MIDRDIQKAAHEAIKKGDLDEICRLINGDRERLEMVTAFGTLLQQACDYGQLNVARWLVSQGLDVNACGRMPDRPPLKLAASGGHVDVVKFLLDSGVVIDVSVQVRNPLFSAVYFGHTEVAKLLIDSGLDTTVRYKKYDALSFARDFGRMDILELLQAKRRELGLSDEPWYPECVDVETEAFISAAKNLPPDRWYEQCWGDVYEYGIRNGLESMSERNRIFFLLGYFVQQLSEGGYQFLYFNPSAPFTPQMADALETLGNYNAARLIREINMFFPGGVPATDNEERWKQLETIPKEAGELGEELETVLHEDTPDGQSAFLSQLHAYYTS